MTAIAVRVSGRTTEHSAYTLTASLLGPDILLRSDLFSDAFSLCSSVRVADQISRSVKQQ